MISAGRRTETYDQATEQVNTVATKARQAVERGKEAFDTARQSAAGQTTGGNGSTQDFSNRPGVADFNTGTRTDRRRVDSLRSQGRGQRAKGIWLFALGSRCLSLSALPSPKPHVSPRTA